MSNTIISVGRFQEDLIQTRDELQELLNDFQTECGINIPMDSVKVVHIYHRIPIIEKVVFFLNPLDEQLWKVGSYTDEDGTGYTEQMLVGMTELKKYENESSSRSFSFKILI